MLNLLMVDDRTKTCKIDKYNVQFLELCGVKQLT